MSNKWWMRDAETAAKEKALNEPLLDDDDDDEDDFDDSSDEEENRDENHEKNEEEKPKTLGAKFWYVATASLGTMAVNVGVAYLVLAGAAVVLAPVVLVPVAAGTLASITSVFAITREKKIAGVTSLRDALNRVRGQVNSLGKQNRKLTKSRKNMSKQVIRLKQCEEKLSDTVERNGVSVDQFIELVEENQKIMSKMKEHFDAKIVQDCVRIIIKYDKDKDYILSTREMPMLIYALKSFDINIENSDEFKAALTNKSVSTAIQYVTDLLEAQGKAEAAKDKYGLSKPDAMEKYRKISD